MQWLLSKQSQEILDASLVSSNSQIRGWTHFSGEEPSPGYYQVKVRGSGRLVKVLIQHRDV